MAFVKNVLINGKTVASYMNKKGETLYQSKDSLYGGMYRIKSVVLNKNGVPIKCQNVLRHNGTSSIDVYTASKNGNTILKSNQNKPIDICMKFVEFASRFLK